jgi:hypothetical protein
MPFRINAVLVANDLSESATSVMRAGGALARLAEAELHVVHAVEAEEPSAAADDRKMETARAGLQAQLGHPRHAPLQGGPSA